MTKYLRAFLFSWLIISFLGLQAAFAYIPPGWFIIKNMSSKRAGLKTLKVASTVAGFDSGKPAGIHFKTVTLYAAQSHVWKSAAYDDAGNELFAIEKKDQEVPLSWTVLCESNAHELALALERAGVPVHETEVKVTPTPEPSPTASNMVHIANSAADMPIPDNTMLKRWNGTVAWVIGRVDGPQFWVEKDSFLPVRLIVKDQDMQYSHYRYAQDLPFPRIVSMANKAGQTEFEETLSESTVSTSSTERATEALMLTFAKDATSDGFFTDAGNASSSALKDLIKIYYYNGVR
jgi:hypothetical protein